MNYSAKQYIISVLISAGYAATASELLSIYNNHPDSFGAAVGLAVTVAMTLIAVVFLVCLVAFDGPEVGPR